MMASEIAPKISIVLSLNQSTYHFSDKTPPELSLTVTSNSGKPVLLFTWHTSLWPKLALAQRQFIITDLTDNVEVTQTDIRLKRMPFTRVRGHPDEVYYLEIVPGKSAVVKTPFGRGDFHPQPKSVVERGWELDDHGNEMKIRRSIHAQGVDGLETGHRYRLDVKKGDLQGIWWRWGTKDDFLVDPDSSDRMWSADQSEQGVIEFEPIEGIEFGVEDWCIPKVLLLESPAKVLRLLPRGWYRWMHFSRSVLRRYSESLCTLSICYCIGIVCKKQELQ